MKQNEPVQKIMSTDLVTATPKQKFTEVKKIMASKSVHHLPIVDEKKLVGIISRLDIMRATLSSAFVEEKEADLILDHIIKVPDIMTRKVVTLKETDTIKQAALVMVQHRFHSLPVLNDKDELVGIVSTVDLLQYLLDQY